MRKTGLLMRILESAKDNCSTRTNGSFIHLQNGNRDSLKILLCLEQGGHMKWNSNKEMSRTKASFVVSKEMGFFATRPSVNNRRDSNLKYPKQKSSFYLKHWR